MRRAAGFTLVEVVVAVALLALALTAIAASQAGAMRTAMRARKMTVATLLARCKMAEIEEQIADEGLPAIESSGEDECCDEGETSGFRCDWLVERIELPDVLLDEEGDEGAAGGAGSPGAPSGPGDLGTADDFLSGDSIMGGGDILTEMAVSFAWPILKPTIEEQVRRATVTVTWNEGTAERSFDVVQFVTAEPAP